MDSILDPDSARDRLTAWKDRIDKMAADTQAMGDRLQELRVTAKDANGLVEVTIDSTGALVGIALTDRMQRTKPDVVSSTIMSTLAEARNTLADQSQEIIADTIGSDSAAAQAITANLNERFRSEEAEDVTPKHPAPRDDEDDLDVDSEFERW